MRCCFSLVFKLLRPSVCFRLTALLSVDAQHCTRSVATCRCVSDGAQLKFGFLCPVLYCLWLPRVSQTLRTQRWIRQCLFQEPTAWERHTGRGAGGVGGMNREIRIDIYALLILCIKQITNENILVSTGNTLSLSLSLYIYIYMVDPSCWAVETNTTL